MLCGFSDPSPPNVVVQEPQVHEPRPTQRVPNLTIGASTSTAQKTHHPATASTAHPRGKSPWDSLKDMNLATYNYEDAPLSLLSNLVTYMETQ